MCSHHMDPSLVVFTYNAYEADSVAIATGHGINSNDCLANYIGCNPKQVKSMILIQMQII